jgi:carbonic anhydrase/acetyltransferase-like protein (isoleucine patch superfamily)
VGIGAVVLDGARIGEGAVVGAGAVVAPGTRVEPGMLVLGVPARAARAATAEERASHREIARAYVETARAHAASDVQA